MSFTTGCIAPSDGSVYFKRGHGWNNERVYGDAPSVGASAGKFVNANYTTATSTVEVIYNDTFSWVGQGGGGGGGGGTGYLYVYGSYTYRERGFQDNIMFGGSIPIPGPTYLINNTGIEAPTTAFHGSCHLNPTLDAADILHIMVRGSTVTRTVQGNAHGGKSSLKMFTIS